MTRVVNLHTEEYDVLIAVKNNMPYADPDKRREAVRRSKQRPEYKEQRRAIYAARYAHPREPIPEEVKKAKKAERDRRYYAKHRAAIRRRKAAYYQTHKDRIRTHYLVSRRNNPQIAIADRLRGLLTQAIRQGYRASSATEYIGCTLAEFKNYIASLFQPGMSWSNYGRWHLDHVKPLCDFDLTNRDQCLQAFHYTNYQPLWAEANLRKNRRENNSRQPANVAV